MIFVFDNFFSDPYAVRNIALKSKYKSDSEGRWPGMRAVVESQKILDHITSKFRNITKINTVELHPGWNSTFQYVTKDYGEGLFHHDDDIEYTSIVYLGLDVPSDSGTEICDDVDPWSLIPNHLWYKHLDIKKDFYKDPKKFLKSYKHGRISKKINSYFNPIAKIPNKFNRIIFFKGKLAHRAQKYYGTSIENSRLTMLTFIK